MSSPLTRLLDDWHWPNRACSEWLVSDGLRWHVQRSGNGPVLLLIHGTAAASHSWREVLPLLATQMSVVAVDLPGHGFTDALPDTQMSLRGMSQALAQLLRRLQCQPDIIVGHSAGAAIGIQLCLQQAVRPELMVSVNGAVLPPQGLAGLMFTPAAKLLAASAWVQQHVSQRMAQTHTIERLLASTGSRIDAAGRDLYVRLMRSPTHVRAVMTMMANWNLRELESQLATLAVPLWLVVGSVDGMVPPHEATRVQRYLPTAKVITLPGLGHLAHEERPQLLMDVLSSWWQPASLSEAV